MTDFKLSDELDAGQAGSWCGLFPPTGIEPPLSIGVNRRLGGFAGATAAPPRRRAA